MNPGETLLQYRIQDRIGSGGMGDVYRAFDSKLDRAVAIKLLPPEVSEDPERKRRFLQEARAASALDHPNIITIFDIAEAEGRQFLVMQYVPGKTLGDLLREGSGRLPLSRALDYGMQIADGLAAAHARGIVHRDLKPDNVVVQENGAVKILDWGLAKLVEPQNLTEAPTRQKERPLTEPGEVVGTPAYMSPEQVQGLNVDARSDVFSFGSILYEMVTGKRAFTASTAPLLMASIVRDEPEPPREILPSIPLELEKWILASEGIGAAVAVDGGFPRVPRGAEAGAGHREGDRRGFAETELAPSVALALLRCRGFGRRSGRLVGFFPSRAPAAPRARSSHGPSGRRAGPRALTRRDSGRLHLEGRGR
jgi:serine/threonine protein kinase